MIFSYELYTTLKRKDNIIRECNVKHSIKPQRLAMSLFIITYTVDIFIHTQQNHFAEKIKKGFIYSCFFQYFFRVKFPNGHQGFIYKLRREIKYALQHRVRGDSCRVITVEEGKKNSLRGRNMKDMKEESQTVGRGGGNVNMN